MTEPEQVAREWLAALNRRGLSVTTYRTRLVVHSRPGTARTLSADELDTMRRYRVAILALVSGRPPQEIVSAPTDHEPATGDEFFGGGSTPCPSQAGRRVAGEGGVMHWTKDPRPRLDDADLRRAAAAAERALTNRIEVWREIIDVDGTVIARYFRGSFPAAWRSEEKD